MKEDSVRSVERAFAIIKCFRLDEPHLNLTSIADAIDLPVTTTYDSSPRRSRSGSSNATAIAFPSGRAWAAKRSSPRRSGCHRTRGRKAEKITDDILNQLIPRLQEMCTQISQQLFVA